MEYIIGTRGSKLALTQTEYVRERLAKAYPEHKFTLKIIKTKGDLIQDRPLDQIGAKGLFVKEIEEEILADKVQMGVHSMKDMPAVPAEGLVFTKSWEREDPRDVLILREKSNLMELPQGAVIGTGSKRRAFQLLRMRPDLQIVDIRGNVDTRLRKMHEQKLDGIVLAAAGLKRMHMEQVITQYLEDEQLIPAPAQGILALEIRSDNIVLREMIDALADEDAKIQASCERTFLDMMGGDCHVPIGAHCHILPEKKIRLNCMFGSEDGKRLAFVTQEGSDPKLVAAQAVHKMREKIAGKVFLVGAGPGDPGLITVKGLQAIRQADCIVYDRLSSPKFLAETKPGCKQIYVGKANHNHTMKQEDINQLLVDMAMRYENVVRLKGGDVYVFGRGGEEGIFLREQGVPFEIIPGISSSIAGLAYGGIPITHRGIATGFHVVTAHNKRDELADIDFQAMASGKDTLVFLMGLSKLPEIAAGLLEAGMRADTPAAVISSATTVAQKTVTASLKEIVNEVQKAGIQSPALIVVGDVVTLREQLNFFEEKPLFGKRYLIPKIGKKQLTLTADLEELGAAVQEVQVGEIVTTTIEMTREDLAKLDWLVFTSKNGVHAFVENLYQNNLDMRALGNVQIACIGKQTAEELRKWGLRADCIPKVYNSDALKELLQQKASPNCHIGYVKPVNEDHSFKETMSLQFQVIEWAVYKNIEIEWACEAEKSVVEEAYDGIFLTCASNVQRFMGHKEMKEMQIKHFFSIGPKTSKAILDVKADCRIEEAEVSTYAGMVKLAKETAINEI